MTLLNNIRKKYSVQVRCDNCGKSCELLIKKGTTVRDAIRDKLLKCDNCGVTIEPKEYTTEFIK